MKEKMTLIIASEPYYVYDFVVMIVIPLLSFFAVAPIIYALFKCMSGHNRGYQVEKRNQEEVDLEKENTC
jgi:hypothetical protein